MKKKDSFEGEKILVVPKKTVKKLHKGLFSGSLYVTDIGYFPKAKYHFRERGNECSEYILIFCIKGSGWIEIHGKRKNLTKNQYFIIPNKTPHRYAADHSNPWTIYWIHFAGNKTTHFILPLDYPRELDASSNSRFGERIRLFEEIYYTLEESHTTNSIEYSSVLLTYLLGSLKYLSQYRRTKEVYEKDPVSKAILYMKDNLDKKLIVNDLASKFGVSVSHFSLLFKKKTSHSPIEHFTFLRMQRACHLLDFTSLRINEIASAIGFQDAYYFTRVFKKAMGKSPSIYRHNLG